MILTQVFKSTEGVHKRCAFENAHSSTHRYKPVRFKRYVEAGYWTAKQDNEPFDAALFQFYFWRIEKTKK